MYKLIGVAIAIITAPIWVPIAIYAGLTYTWKDTVPKEEDYDY
jgi:hypothetical protein